MMKSLITLLKSCAVRVPSHVRIHYLCSLYPNGRCSLTQLKNVVLYVLSMEGAASAYRNVSADQEIENREMVDVLSQAKAPDLTPAENAAKMTDLMRYVPSWHREVKRRIELKESGGLYCRWLIAFA